MNYELFGVSPFGNLEFLGTFVKERQLFAAADDYRDMGFKNIKFCTWKANQQIKVSYPSMWLD